MHSWKRQRLIIIIKFRESGKIYAINAYPERVNIKIKFRESGIKSRLREIQPESNNLRKDFLKENPGKG